jgi:hypothetical protein
VRSLRYLTLGLAALLLLVWLATRRRDTTEIPWSIRLFEPDMTQGWQTRTLPPYEPQPTREWHPDRYPYLLPVHDGGSICLTDEYLEAL